ncbi:hypothetical protein [Desertivirga arenae]|nr:hypothetical protein [Pedobacter sp. SYSU D00823]
MRRINKGVLLAWLFFLTGVFIVIFWYNEQRYSTTPSSLPASYIKVP